MKLGKVLWIVICLSFTLTNYAQTGSSSDPFTSLSQAWNVSSDGIYFFDVDNNTFSTFVEQGSGWILIASGDGDTPETSYDRTSALTLQSDMILDSAVYSSSEITAVRMNASDLPLDSFDVVSENDDVLSNLSTDQTLSVNTNGPQWTGTGTTYLLRRCGSNNSTLATRIYHACGNQGAMHWQVGQNSTHEKLVFSNGNKSDFNLWMRADMPLPVELIEFKAQVEENIVNLFWSTSNEINSEFFTVERSINGNQWQDIIRIEASGNSSQRQDYEAIDRDPIKGTSYYRLKQTDLDGQFQYFDIVGISFNGDKASVHLYPNPAHNVLFIESIVRNETPIQIFNITGEKVFEDTITILGKHGVDITSLLSGIYYIKVDNQIVKFIKK